MGKIKALIVGVSYYISPNLYNLPFCKIDIQAIYKSFTTGLNVSPSDIYVLGESGIVTSTEFFKTLRILSSVSEDNDTFLFYFSGHGGRNGNQLVLAFSDIEISTQTIIDFLNKINAKSKVIFLDCCKAGSFEVSGSAQFDINQTVEEFVGHGFAVLAACKPTQCSSKYPGKEISLFTYFLYYALTDKSIIREGKKSLNDIHKLLFLFLAGWNKALSDKGQSKYEQNPIYRSNLGGTIFFEVQDFTPYRVASFIDETDKYYITSVEPLHSGIAKRYAVKVILKQPFAFTEIASINYEIVEKVKYKDIFSNAVQEARWSGKPANIVFCYYALDESDISIGNFICHTTWVDETQDKDHWYQINKGNEIIDGVFFSIYSYYESFKAFVLEHTASKEQIIKTTRMIIRRMITLAEKIISHFNEFTNGDITEGDLVISIESVIPELETLYFTESDLDIPPPELEDWSLCCSELAATIHDFTLFYNSKYLSTRTPENRKQCMDITIRRYYQNLEKLKQMDQLE